MSRNSSSGRAGIRACIAFLGVIALAGCSAASTGGTGAPDATAPTAAPATPTAAAVAPTTPSGASAPASTSAAPPVAGAGATDFCSAWKEFQEARNMDTPEETGAGFRAAATDVRTYAPAEIKAAAGLLADVLDGIGQSILAGGPQPETLGQGQSAERQAGLKDAIAWITKNCP